MKDENLRLETLERYKVLDSLPEEPLNDIVELAAQICETPIALISLVDDHRQWFKAKVGIQLPETPREISFCAHAIQQKEILVVPDATLDPRFRENPLVTGAPGIRFYAGAPLLTSEGVSLGTLCVKDHIPRTLTPLQEQTLRVMARQVMIHLELGRHMRGMIESEERLKMVTEKARVGLVIVNAAHRYLYTNNTYAEILDLPPGNLIGQKIADVLPTVYEEQIRPRLEQAFTGERVSFELKKAGSHGPRYYLVRYEPTQSENEDPLVVVVITDVTDRKAAEIESGNRNADLQLILDAVPALIFYKDRDSRFVRVNKQLAKLADCLPDAFIGKTDCEMGFPEGDRYREQDVKVMSTGQPLLHCEEQIHTKEGIRYLLTDKVPSRDLDGKVNGVIGFAVDITEKKKAEEAREEASRFARATFDALSAHICVLDETGTILATNRAWNRFAESNPPLSRRADKGANYIEVCENSFGPEASSGKGFVTGLREVIHGDRLEFQMEYPCHSPTEQKWFIARVTRFTGNNPVRVVVAHENITERKQAERLSQRLASIVSSSDDAIIGKDLSSNVTSWNRGAERIFGYSAEEMIGTSIVRLIPEDRQEEETYILGKIGRGESVEHFETKRLTKDGRLIDVSVTASPIRDSENRIIGVSKVARDVTERRKAESQIAEQADILDKARDAILVRNLMGDILFWNKGAERIYGWTSEEALEKNSGPLLYEKPEQFCEINRLTIEKGEWTGELKHLTKNKREIVIEARWTLIRDNEGKAKSVLAINTDITEKKKIEAQFMRAQRMESIGTLAGGVAHDLNNILAPIMMSIELLKTMSKDEGALKILETIEISSKRGADIVRQVLSFARGMEGDRVEIQPKHLLQDLQHIIKDTFPKNIDMSFKVPSDVWTLRGDPTQVHQVLLNLSVNARDAMPNGGSLQIEVQNVVLDEQYATMNIQAKPGRYVMVSVTDSGIGIPQSIMDKVFEPFFTTKEIQKGTGLGLSTVMAIVKSHEGIVNVYSEPGQGTTFKIYLPASENEESNARRFTEEASLPRGNGETVLIVDDEASILSITSQTLQAFGYRVLTSTDGAAAIATYATHQQEVAVVLTDMMMPIMDGPATIHALIRINPKIKIIAASGLNANGSVAKASGAGVKHFLAKPYTAGTLLKTVHTILKETG